MRRAWLFVLVLVSCARADTASFWKWFVTHADELRAEKNVRTTFERVDAELKKSHPDVFAEIAADGEERTLVLADDGNRDHFPKVLELYAARPKVHGWTIVAFRQRAKADDPMTAIVMDGKTLDPGEVKFTAQRAKDKLDVRLFIPGFTTTHELGSLGFIILDHTVGEYDMEMKIGAVDFAVLAKAPGTARPLRELPALLAPVAGARTGAGRLSRTRGYHAG
jgi:hypothetical protein